MWATACFRPLGAVWGRFERSFARHHGFWYQKSIACVWPNGSLKIWLEDSRDVDAGSHGPRQGSEQGTIEDFGASARTAGATRQRGRSTCRPLTNDPAAGANQEPGVERAAEACFVALETRSARQSGPAGRHAAGEQRQSPSAPDRSDQIGRFAAARKHLASAARSVCSSNAASSWDSHGRRFPSARDRWAHRIRRVGSAPHAAGRASVNRSPFSS